MQSAAMSTMDAVTETRAHTDFQRLAVLMAVHLFVPTYAAVVD